MDFSITQNRFAPLSQGESMDGWSLENTDNGDFQTVKRRCVRASPSPSSMDSVINQFSTISVDEKLTAIYSDVQRVIENQKETNRGMDFLNNSMACTNKNVDQLVKVSHQNTRMLRLLAYKSIDLEARARRNNLIFRNLMYKRGDDCSNVVRHFMTDQLKLEGFDVDLERVHPFGPPSKYTGRRDIIVAFLNFADTEVVMRHVGALKGTPFVIDRDHPKEIQSARKRLWPKFKAAKASGSGNRVSIQFPAKLVVNGSVIHDEFPDWYNVLAGDRDINLHKTIYEPPPISTRSDNNDHPPHTSSVPTHTPHSGSRSDTRDSLRGMYDRPITTTHVTPQPFPVGNPVATGAETSSSRSDTRHQLVQPPTDMVHVPANRSDAYISSIHATPTTDLLPNTSVDSMSGHQPIPVQAVTTCPIVTTTVSSSDKTGLSAPFTSNGAAESAWPMPTIQPSIFKSSAPANIPSHSNTPAPPAPTPGTDSGNSGRKPPVATSTVTHKPRSVLRRTSTRDQTITRSDSAPANISRAGSQRGKRTGDLRNSNSTSAPPTFVDNDTGQPAATNVTA